MDRTPVPLYLEDIVHDTWEACRQSLLYSGRLLDFLAFTVPGAVPAVDRVQLALDAVFDEMHALPESVPRGVGGDRIRTRDDLDKALDELVDATAWEHPSQVLSRPRPDPGDLLAICALRLEDAKPRQRKRLTAVRNKLERSRRIADEARGQRQKMTTRPDKSG